MIVVPQPVSPSIARDPAAPYDAAAAVEPALAALRHGRPIVIGEDLAGGSAVYAVVAAALATPATVNDLATAARGILGVTLTDSRAGHLQCVEIPRKRVAPQVPRYGVSVEAASGVSTGISAADRAETARKLCDPAAQAQDFVRPGHIMPVVVGPRGSLDRPLGPEAAHDLTALAGVAPGALVSHVLDGLDALPLNAFARFAGDRGWPCLRCSDVLAYRAHHERLVRVVSEGTVATVAGPFRIRIYEHELDGTSHIALVKDAAPGTRHARPPLVRLHSQCLTGDILHSRRCDCGAQLHEAMRRLADAGAGAIVYLRQEGRGIGLVQKIRAYALQDQGRDTVEANLDLGFQPDERDYAVAAQILRDLDMPRVRLLTNNPHKVWALQRLGIEVAVREPLVVPATPENARYLQTKRDRMGHWLDESPPTNSTTK
jgi:3,4-dihydroxy 2-butanone 4-phosphate synthase/GTP cyclohydrolase II